MCVAAAAGCGFGPGPSSEGTATLTVTRDYGSKTLVDEAETDPHSSETVIRFLDREADITTRYGGGFVQSIDGLAGAERAGRRYDWFFYVNGIESPVGAAEVHVHGGDRIWWDYRDWTDAMQVPAVVGSWPEPFTQAAASGDRRPVRWSAWPPAARATPRLTASQAPGWTRASSGGEEGARRERRALGSWSGPGARCAMIRRSTSCVAARRQPACSRASRARGRLPPDRPRLQRDAGQGPRRRMPAWWPRCEAAMTRRPGSSRGRQGPRCGEPRALSMPLRCATAMPWPRRCTGRRSRLPLDRGEGG